MKIKLFTAMISISALLMLSGCGDQSNSSPPKSIPQTSNRPQDKFVNEFLALNKSGKDIDTSVRGGDEKWDAYINSMAEYKKRVYGSRVENWTCTVDHKEDLTPQYEGNDVSFNCIGNIADRPYAKIKVDESTTRKEAEGSLKNMIKNDQEFAIYPTKENAISLKKVYPGDEVTFSGEISFIENLFANNVKVVFRNSTAQITKQGPSQ